MTTALEQHVLDLSHHTSEHQLANIEVAMDMPTTSTAGIPVPGASFTIPAGDKRPYEIRFGCQLYSPTIGATPLLDLLEDGVMIGSTCWTIGPIAYAVRSCSARRRRLPAMVSHLYTLRARSLTGASVNIVGYANAGPIYMQAVTQ